MVNRKGDKMNETPAEKYNWEQFKELQEWRDKHQSDHDKYWNMDISKPAEKAVELKISEKDTKFFEKGASYAPEGYVSAEDVAKEIKFGRGTPEEKDIVEILKKYTITKKESNETN